MVAQPIPLNRFIIGCGLMLLVSAIWAPSLRNGFCWDDRRLIVENKQLTEPGAIGLSFRQDFWESPSASGGSDYYRPIVTISYILDHHLWDLDPRGYHATNILLHALLCVLLFFLLIGVGLPEMTAATGALLFGIHPVFAENVAWVSGRTDVLAALFMVMYLLLNQQPGSVLRRILSLTALALALLSKEIAVTALPIIIVWRLLQGFKLKRIMASLWPDLMIMSLYFAVRAEVLGATAAKELLSPTIHASTAFFGFFHLIGILLLPQEVRIEYAPDLPAGVLLTAAAAGSLLILLLGGALKARTNRDARMQEYPDNELSLNKFTDNSVHVPTSAIKMLGTAALISLLPLAAAIITKGVLGPRLVYLSGAFTLPLIISLALSVPPFRFSAAVVLVLIASQIFLTRQRIPLWLNEHTLFQHAFSAPHPSVRTHLNLAIAFHDQGRLNEALKHLTIAAPLASLKKTHYTFGLILGELGCSELAVREYRRALEITPGDPASANNLGAILAETGRYSEAQEVLESALKALGGDDQALQFNLARVRSELQRDEPLSKNHAYLECESMTAALERASDPVKLNRQALLWLKKHQYQHAEILIKAALLLNPELLAAQLNRVQLYLLTERQVEAEAELISILQGHPDNPQALNLLRYMKRAKGSF